MNRVQPKPVRLQLEADGYDELRQQVLPEMGGDVNCAAGGAILRSTAKNFAASQETIPNKI